MKEKHGFWLHHIRSSKSSVSGFFYLPECDCSCCGETMRMEKDICPVCGAIMDKEIPAAIQKEIDAFSADLKKGEVEDTQFTQVIRKVLQKETGSK